jgi:hypothetical protein
LGGLLIDGSVNSRIKTNCQKEGWSKLLINKKNLQIAKYCTDKPTVQSGKTFATNTLEIRPERTTVTNNAYSISVSTLQGGGEQFLLTKEDALAASPGDPSALKAIAVEGKFPNLDAYWDRLKDSSWEFTVDARFLLHLAQSVNEFGGEVVRFRFYRRDLPLRMDSINAEEQTWDAFLMPRSHDHLIPPAPVPAPPAPAPVEEDEFAKALRLAAEM